MKRRITALLLAGCLLLACLTGCGSGGKNLRGTVTQALQNGSGPVSTPEPTPVPTREPAPEPTAEPDPPGHGGEEQAPVGRGYFRDDVWRSDLAYDEMEYEHYLPRWFDEYTAPIYEMAEKGGGAEEFQDADFYLVDELYYVYTMMQLADLRQSADPADEKWQEELLYSMELYYTLNDEYWQAMHALAVSPHAGLLEESYPDYLIDWFEDYEPGDGTDLSLYSRENELVNRYYTLMAEDEPDTGAIGEVFVSLVELRREIAALSGYGGYAEYAYDSLYYKDYTPEDARQVWAGVKEQLVPLMQRYSRQVWRGTDALESSGAVDCSSEAVLAAMEQVLPLISPELYDCFAYMREYGLYDIEHDPAKANTGYTTTLYYLNEPFIFNAAYGEFYDYTDMFHEFGHFANAFYNQSDLLFGYPDNDLCELQSQGMELIFTHYYDRIFGEYADEALNYVLMNMVYSIVDGALYDEFQQRVYEEEELSPERVNEIFAGLYREYGYQPYEGYETEWMGISHNFEQPFYYISYCVSALGALELYQLAEEDWPAAVDRYLTVCAMDPEAYYYSEALEEAGLADIFAPDTYVRVAEALEKSFRQ